MVYGLNAPTAGITSKANATTNTAYASGFMPAAPAGEAKDQGHERHSSGDYGVGNMHLSIYSSMEYINPPSTYGHKQNINSY